MRVFKTTYKDRKGRTKEAASWYVEFRDHLETVRRLPGSPSKAASEELGRGLEKLVAYHKASGGQIDPALSRWLAGLPAQTKEKLVKIGLLDRERGGAAKLLTGHLDDWAQALRAKGTSDVHVELVTGRARRIIDGCGFKHHADIRASKVQTYLNDLRPDTAERRGIGAQTFNFYLSALRQFCRWMVRDRRATDSPVAHLDGLNVRTDRRHDRRPFTADELRRLIDTTAAGPDREGMTGPERAMLYRLAAETGLRQNELRSLTRSSFDLNAAQPTVTVEAAYSKHRRQDVLPLRPALAAMLREFLANKLPEATAFGVPVDRHQTANLFQADLEAAGIAYRDDDGRYADFHALRHSFITNLANGGVHPKTAQALARHSTIALTMDKYTHSLIGEQAEALDVLPDLDLPAAEMVRATGTAGRENVLASCLALSGGPGAPLRDSNGLLGGEGLQCANHGERADSTLILPSRRGAGAADRAGLENRAASSDPVTQPPSPLTPSADTSATSPAVLASCLALLAKKWPDLATAAAVLAELPEADRRARLDALADALGALPLGERARLAGRLLDNAATG